ncbi:tRNA lysidine(34) synthetase TilS [Geitlerinema sp. PCC 7407]|uniref:tRNA lysidine(34) synthetase TilS n=1 Tax=Geitlerinema sp. PCC 7407 TaxID=1173025 RepID=UPI00029FA06C|nr:tRNA lysidine(34) synthetase TilS [Geitlerinema sp. PCC 7407]AFY67135.1 tRNA(Ile)-lysidine synthetase [Geitlerinema sp. PCC 7407]
MRPRSPWSPLHARLHQTLRQRALVLSRERLLIAVSGGQDSLCLAKLLVDLQPKWEWTLAIAHCDHRWRPDSEANARHVRSLAQAWGVDYFQEVAGRSLPSEAAARQWRYEALTAIAQQGAFSRILTGHTASDRAETLLFNLLRGSGADGLQALTWRRPLAADVELVRPLLNFTRTETGDFCRTGQLPVWEDSTNQDLSYRRNRIRQELLPYLSDHFNPRAEQALAQTAELLQDDVQYLEAEATAWRLRAQDPAADQPSCRINRRILQGAPLALQRRSLRQWLQLHLPQQPTFGDIEKVVALLSAPQRHQSDPFPGGAIARVQGEWIELVGPMS